MELCVRNDLTDKIMPCYTRTEQLLAEFFNIDLNKMEKEKQAMLNKLRTQNSKRELRRRKK